MHFVSYVLCLSFVGKLQEQSILDATISFLARRKRSLREMNRVLYFRCNVKTVSSPRATRFPLRGCLYICNFPKFLEINFRNIIFTVNVNIRAMYSRNVLENNFAKECENHGRTLFS